jgi:O-antigen ligase
MVKFQVFGVPFNVMETVVYAVFLASIFGRKWDFEILRGKFFKFLLPMALLLLGCLGGLYVSSQNGELMKALGILKGWVIMPMIFAFLVMFFVNSAGEKKSLLYSYFLSSIILAGWGLYQVGTGNYTTIDGRASGPFESANYLALYIAPAVIASFVFLRQRIEEGLREGRGDVYFEILAFVVCSLALIFSRSYGGILGVFSALFLYAIYEIFFSNFSGKYGSFLRKIIILVVVVLAAFTSVISQVGTAKFKDFLVFDRQSSSSVRIQVWTVALDEIKENPVLGIGLGGFENVYEKKAVEILGAEPYEKTMLHPHNLLFSSWLNAGILGLISICWLVVSVLLALRKKDRMAVVFIAMFLVIFIHGIVDQPFWKNDLALIWWMVVASVI